MITSLRSRTLPEGTRCCGKRCHAFSRLVSEVKTTGED
jgi:hypothetical protein